MAVVKADAYGHGADRVAVAAVEAGATWLGVALVEEGVALRMRTSAPILVLSEVPPGSEMRALQTGLTPSLYTDGGLERLAAAAEGRSLGVHVKVDTGMHRVGVWPPEETVAFLSRVHDAGLSVEGLWTHFAKSEEDERTTTEQLERFRAVIVAARAAGFAPGGSTRRTAAARSATRTPRST